MNHTNPYGSDEAELTHLRLRCEQREESGGVYADTAAIEARIAELEAQQSDA